MDLIRPFQPSDRGAVRHLAIDTAEMGKRSTFADHRLQADLLTRYYTDHEPGSTWVLEREGKVVGYLTGCLDTRKFLDWLRFRGNALTAAHVIFRNFHRPAVWRWARARVRTLREGGAHRAEWVGTYPAHLHLNLAEGARGGGVGARLLEAFVGQCRAAGVTGIHLSTRADNDGARRFFQRNGFLPVADINAYRAGAGGLEPVPVLILGRKLRP